MSGYCVSVPQTLPIGSDKIKHRLFAVGVVGFLSALAIGVDGHPIFQILAVESLGLGPRAIGIALGLGTLSVPLQIWAARIPLHRARHNLRLFLWSMGAMVLLTAALVAFAEPGTWVAGLALVVAVVAEISVSVLLATAWQPLIAYSLSPAQRAFMLGPASAIRGLVILGSTVLVGTLDRTGRTLFLLVVGAAVIVVAETLRRLPAPNRSNGSESASTVDKSVESVVSGTSGGRAPLPPGVVSLYVLTATQGFSRWPLLVTYAAVTLWPDGNLGLLGAALTAGGIVISMLWRDPGARVLTLLRAGVVITTLCTALLVTLDGPVSSTTSVGLLLTTAVVGSAARTVAGTASMELVHRRVDDTNSVRVMTMLDVIGSTTSQANMFVAGFLIAAGTGPGLFLGLDVYQLWILLTMIAYLIATARLRLRPGDVGSSATG